MANYVLLQDLTAHEHKSGLSTTIRVHESYSWVLATLQLRSIQ